MAKAILVLDMPESCMTCRLAINKTIPLETAFMCSINSKWSLDKECESRPAWCSLKELPQKKAIHSEMPLELRNYRKGFNACIDEILGGSK